MKRIEINAEDFIVQPHKLWSRDWLLLGAGDPEKGNCNAMTVGWGSFGTMWGKPFAMIVVRPQRHTASLIDTGDAFTLSAFPEEYRAALQFCGSKSGKDIADKIAQAGLTAEACSVAAPAFAEAELVIECRKIFESVMTEDQFIDKANLEQWYPQKDLHRIWFGEIVRITGTEKYLAK